MADSALRGAGFSGRILMPGSLDFTKALHRPNASAQREAALIAFPGSTKDVSIAITFAVGSNLKIAVKCGGHNYSGSNSVQGGLVIDLGDLKSVSVDKKNGRVTLGGGCRWVDVYQALDKERLTCVGGAIHDVGVGGYLTGGGYSLLSWKYGMACDNILEATVVVADGRVLRATETENPDLFFAIRGGGGSFGIATEFILKTFPDQSPYFSQAFGFPADDRDVIFREFRAFLKRNADDSKVLGFLTYVRDQNLPPVVVLNFLGFGALDSFRNVFEPFLSTARPVFERRRECVSLVDFSHVLDDFVLIGAPRRANGGTPLTGLWAGMAEELWDRWISYTDANPDAIKSKIVIEFHNTRRVRPETSCISVSLPRHSMFLTIEQHTDPAGDGRAELWTHELNNVVRKYQAENGGQDLGINGNASMLIEKSEDIWGKNYPRLRKIKAKYDPNLVFNRFYPIEPDFMTNSTVIRLRSAI